MLVCIGYIVDLKWFAQLSDISIISSEKKGPVSNYYPVPVLRILCSGRQINTLSYLAPHLIYFYESGNFLQFVTAALILFSYLLPFTSPLS